MRENKVMKKIGKWCIFVICFVLLVVSGVACVYSLSFLKINENSVIDITSQMNQTDKAELSERMGEFEVSKGTNFVFAYQSDYFEINEEYIQNIDKISDGTPDVIYVYMKEEGQMYKVVDGIAQEMSQVSSDSGIVEQLILDMSRTESNGLLSIKYVSSAMSVIVFVSLLIIFIKMQFKRKDSDD
ncbi:MAG: hypothetical protein PHP54_04650 [Clostridia bacterium]|nr:hypothetical protein [Clostridia bacterium]